MFFSSGLDFINTINAIPPVLDIDEMPINYKVLFEEKLDCFDNTSSTKKETLQFATPDLISAADIVRCALEDQHLDEHKYDITMYSSVNVVVVDNIKCLMEPLIFDCGQLHVKENLDLRGGHEIEITSKTLKWWMNDFRVVATPKRNASADKYNISLEMPGGDILSVPVSPRDNVSSIHSIIRANSPKPLSLLAFSVYKNDVVISNIQGNDLEESTFESRGVPVGALLTVKENPIPLWVEFEGEAKRIHMLRLDSVAVLRTEITRLFSAASEDCHVLYMGKILDNNSSLALAGVLPFSTLVATPPGPLEEAQLSIRVNDMATFTLTMDVLTCSEVDLWQSIIQGLHDLCIDMDHHRAVMRLQFDYTVRFRYCCTVPFLCPALNRPLWKLRLFHGSVVNVRLVPLPPPSCRLRHIKLNKPFMHEVVSIALRTGDTVQQLKQRVEHSDGIPVEQQVLLLRNRILDDDALLEELGIEDGVSLELELALFHCMEIYVKTLTGKTFSLYVVPHNTIDTVKQMIYEVEGVPPSEQQLIFGGRLLSGNCMVADYNIKRKDIIRLVLRLRGGMYLAISSRENFLYLKERESTSEVEVYTPSAPSSRSTITISWKDFESYSAALCHIETTVEALEEFHRQEKEIEALEI